MKQKNVGYALLAGSMLFGFVIASSAYAADTTLCMACHGVAENEIAPNIAGLSARYIAVSLKRFKEKQRPCDSGMCDMAADFSDADMDDLGQQFAKEKFVRAEQTFDAALVAKGKKVHDRYCEKCHTGGGSNAGDNVGILAGQKMGFMRNQIDFILTGQRIVHKKMTPKIEALSKDEIEAVLNYYASLK